MRLHLTLGVPGVAAPSLGEGFLLLEKEETNIYLEFRIFRKFNGLFYVMLCKDKSLIHPSIHPLP